MAVDINFIPQAVPTNTPLQRTIAHLSNRKLAKNQQLRDKIASSDSEICIEISSSHYD